MGDFFNQLWTIILTLVDPRNLSNPDAFKAALNQPGVFAAAFAAVALIIFMETGLFVGILLPGDSLLVTTGLVAHQGDWPIHWLIPMLILAAIIGDSTGYGIGAKAGPKLFTRDSSFFFRKKYLLKSQEFYDRHGGKTIILCKFVPFLRTFAPVVAGIGKMPYRRFLAFSIVGAILWISSMILIGYTLHLWLEPILEKIFGRKVEVAKNIDKLVLVVIFVSILPLLIKGFRSWRASRNAAVTPDAASPVPPAPPAPPAA
ncbi:MAG: VTT domain-containing protein [Gemmataceae bacterium]